MGICRVGGLSPLVVLVSCIVTFHFVSINLCVFAPWEYYTSLFGLVQVILITLYVRDNTGTHIVLAVHSNITQRDVHDCALLLSCHYD
jgi:hypothetical protein